MFSFSAVRCCHCNFSILFQITTVCVNINIKIDRVGPAQVLKSGFLKRQDPEALDFEQYLPSLCTDKIFKKIRPVFLREFANRQTNSKQANDG